MSSRIHAVGEIASTIVEQAQTSKRALVAEAIGTVVGYSGFFIVDQPVPAIVLGAIGIGSGMVGLANIEYQGAVNWQSPPEKDSQ